MAHKARAVRVVAGKLVLLVPQRVGGTDRSRRPMSASGRGKGGFLVRQGDITAGKAQPAQIVEKGGYVFGTNRLFAVATGDAVLVEPIAVNERGARMRHWPADDAGLGHVPISLRTRSSCNKGSIGSPMMVEASPCMQLNS